MDDLASDRVITLRLNFCQIFLIVKNVYDSVLKVMIAIVSHKQIYIFIEMRLIDKS